MECVRCTMDSLGGKLSIKNHNASINRANREEVMRTCGLVKVRSESGKIYWE